MFKRSVRRDELISGFDRICPGQSMATRSLFLIFSSILSTFNISPPLDEFGNPTKLRPVMLSGVHS